MPGIDDLSLATALLLAAIFLFAGLVHGTLGLGFPMMATPLLALMTDVRSAILITLLPTVAVNILSILKGGRWRESIGTYWPLIFYVGIGSVLGTRLLIQTDPAPYKLLLATLILLYLNIERFKGIKLHWVKAHPASALVAFGVLAGFSAGTVNVMVPILIILFLELHASPTAMVQVFNMCFLTGKITQTLVFVHTSTMTAEIALATAPLAALGVSALLIGMAIRERVDAQTYRRWLKHALWIVALVLVAQYFLQR